MSETQTYELELRRISLEERRVENERRATRTEDEAALDVAVRQATTLADSPVLFYDETRVKKIADEEGASSDEPETRRKAWIVARQAYRNERIAFAVQLLAFAQAMSVPLALLAGQAHIVKGRTGFATSFLIGLVNSRAKLQTPIDWTVSGEGAALAVTCSATDSHGIVRDVTITMEQARAWGWAKTDPWRADPALMLRYRSAAQLIRLYFSASVFGLPLVSVEELRDIRDEERVTVTQARPPGPPKLPDGVIEVQPEPLDGSGEE